MYVFIYVVYIVSNNISINMEGFWVSGVEMDPRDRINSEDVSSPQHRNHDHRSSSSRRHARERDAAGDYKKKKSHRRER